jgi:hypothetical protein
MAKRTRKGGYLSWNPMNWFKAAPETPSEGTQPTGSITPPDNSVTDSTPTSSTPKYSFGSNNASVGGRHTRRHRRGAKKTRSGKKSNRR